MYEHMLVPTNDRIDTDWATETAVKLAEDDATIHALYVVDTTSSMGHYDAYIEEREREGERAVEAVEDRAHETDNEAKVVKAFRYGAPHREILGYAADHDISLIVLEAPRRTGLARFVHPPSAVTRVARRADVPVIIMQGDTRTAETATEA